jgi:hypothetical protein
MVQRSHTFCIQFSIIDVLHEYGAFVTVSEQYQCLLTESAVGQISLAFA